MGTLLVTVASVSPLLPGCVLWLTLPDLLLGLDTLCFPSLQQGLWFSQLHFHMLSDD